MAELEQNGPSSPVMERLQAEPVIDATARREMDLAEARRLIGKAQEENASSLFVEKEAIFVLDPNDRSWQEDPKYKKFLDGGQIASERIATVNRGDTRNKYATEKELRAHFDELMAGESESGRSTPLAVGLEVNERGENIDAEEESGWVEGEFRVPVWYEKLGDDLREASRFVHEFKDKDKTTPRDPGIVANEKRSKAAARQRLQDKEVKTDIFDERGGSRRVSDARNMIFEGKSSRIGQNEVEAREILDGMNIDVDEVIRERDNKRAGKPGEPVTDGTTVAPDERERTEKPNKETIGEFIRANEVLLNNLLLKDWDPALGLSPDRDKLVKLLEFSSSIHKDELLRRLSASDLSAYEEVFIVAQDVYLKEILSEKSFLQIAGTSQNYKRQESISEEINEELRTRFGGKLAEFATSIYNGDKRRWFEYGADGERMRSNLEEYLIKRFNTPEIDQDRSEKGVVVRYLKTVYLQSDEIRGTQELKIAKEPRAELLRQLIKIHDLTVVMDAPTFRSTENIRPELLQSVDEAMIAMLKIQKDGVSVVPAVIEVYDTVMRERYNSTGREINIDDDAVFLEVRNRLGVLFGPAEETEARLFMKMGRDLCRITGLDAQYGLPVNVASGVKSGLELTVKGNFLRSLLNYNKLLITYGSDPRLTGNIALGMYPFWNKLRGIKEISSAPITADQITSLVDTKMTGNSNFESWVGTLKGFSEAKKAEGDFIASPTLDNFITKVVPAYWGYMQYTPAEAKEYFWRRLDSVVPYFISKGEGQARLKMSIINLFMKDGNFDGKGVFENAQELKKFFSKWVNINISPATRFEDTRKIGKFIDRLFREEL